MPIRFILIQSFKRNSKEKMHKRTQIEADEAMFGSASPPPFDPFSDEIILDDDQKNQQIWSLKRGKFSLIEEILPIFDKPVEPLQFPHEVERENFEESNSNQRKYQLEYKGTSDITFKLEEQQSVFASKTPCFKPIASEFQEQAVQKHRKRKRQKKTGVGKCHCKNSHCLQLYCQCFKRGGICGEQCQCVGCENIISNKTQINKVRQRIEEEDPSAFKEQIPYKGCKCTKNQCMKKYCDCFKIGVVCGKYCKCSGCKNHLGSPGSKRGKANKK